MAVTVRIPTPLRRFTDGKDRLLVEGATVGALLEQLRGPYPGLVERILDEQGQPRRFVNLYYREEDIRFLESLDTRVDAGGELTIVPAIAGGR
jgi:molybdopterin synthase sulfur carrier subunit